MHVQISIVLQSKSKIIYYTQINSHLGTSLAQTSPFKVPWLSPNFFITKIIFTWPNNFKMSGIHVVANSGQYPYSCPFHPLIKTKTFSKEVSVESAMLNCFNFPGLFSKMPIFPDSKENSLSWLFPDLEDFFPWPFPNLWQLWDKFSFILILKKNWFSVTYAAFQKVCL